MWDAGRGLTLIPGEVSEQDHCRDIMQQAVAEFGRPDILVNNAAMRRIHQDISHAQLPGAGRVQPGPTGQMGTVEFSITRESIVDA